MNYEDLCKKTVPNFSCYYQNSVCFSPLAETDFYYTPTIMTRKYSCVPLSHSYKVSIDRSLHFEVNRFQKSENLCVTLRNVTTEHLFLSTIKHTFWELFPNI